MAWISSSIRVRTYTRQKITVQKTTAPNVFGHNCSPQYRSSDHSNPVPALENAWDTDAYACILAGLSWPPMKLKSQL